MYRFEGKNILLISPEPWDHIFVSKHHYAINLAKRGNQIYFLNPPRKKKIEVLKTNYDGVYSVEYTGFPKGLRFYPRILQKHFIRKKFQILERLCNQKFDVIWSFDNSVFFDFSALPKDVLKISHIVDLNQDFQSRRSSETADYCFCTAGRIFDRIKKHNTRVLKVNHGFSDAPNDITSCYIPGFNRVACLYAGNLAIPYIDWICLWNLVRENPTVDFIFVGPGKEIMDKSSIHGTAKKSVLEADNSFFIGSLSSENLLSLEKSVDIVLVSYQEKFHAEQSNPHKMMEYMGSGTMIVATYVSEFDLQGVKDLFLMCKSNAEIPRLFQTALENLDYWNSNGMKKARMEFASNNSYNKQIDRIEHFIIKELD